MHDEYDFSKGERGGFYHPDAKMHLPEKDDLVYGDGNNLGAAMTDYSLTPEAETLVCSELQKAFPNALGIYAFGSRVQGSANAQSDLDLAVLVAGYADPLELFEMANQLADKLGYEVDLLDLRAASTVMQHQVITTGRRLWAKDVQADLFDVFVLNEKLDFDELRAEQLNEIRETGRIYGK
jgi:predicted nucleotidyltransferase